MALQAILTTENYDQAVMGWGEVEESAANREDWRRSVAHTG